MEEIDRNGGSRGLPLPSRPADGRAKAKTQSENKRHPADAGDPQPADSIEENSAGDGHIDPPSHNPRRERSIGRAWVPRYARKQPGIIKENYQHLEDNKLLTATVEENVIVQLENLRTHPLVAARLSAGKLRLHGWVYKIETGEVFGYDPDQCQFLALQDA